MSKQMVFENKDGVDFSGIYACREWLAARGFSYGEMCREMPMGVLKGDAQIAKWKNLNHIEKQLFDGVIEPLAFGWRGEGGGARLTLSDATAPDDMVLAT